MRKFLFYKYLFIKKSIVFVLLFFGLGSEIANACSLARKPFFWIDPPANTRPDCSVTKAGEGFYDVLEGEATFKLQNEMIAQVLHDGGGCERTQSLLVADCKSRESIWVNAPEHPTYPSTIGGVGPVTKVEHMIEPVGPIDLTKIASIEILTELASKNELKYNLNVVEMLKKRKKRNRFDPFCGCKLFYPESAGES